MTFEDSESEKTPEQKLTENLTRFNISSLEHTFEKFRINQENKKAVETLKKIASGESHLKFILLYGKTGSGKTHLIEATIIEWARKGKPSRYNTFSDIVRRLKSGIGSSGQYDIYFKQYCDLSRLIVDDFGMGTQETKFEIADLEDIIDIRYRKRFYPDFEQVTIMGTNKDPNTLPERVLSRFCDPEVGILLSTGNIDYRRRIIK